MPESFGKELLHRHHRELQVAQERAVALGVADASEAGGEKNEKVNDLAKKIRTKIAYQKARGDIHKILDMPPTPPATLEKERETLERMRAELLRRNGGKPLGTLTETPKNTTG